MKKFLPLCLCLALAAGPAVAGFEAHRLSAADGPVKLDGVLDDAAWRQAKVADQFYENQPRDKVAASVKTEVRILYDERYFYVGIMAHDAHPELIRAPFIRRDKIGGDQDFIGLFIDPAGAGKSAQIIYFNPRGAFTDGMYSDTNGEDYALDFDFDIATARVDGGWSAEVRIPLSSLPYAAGQQAPWKLLVMRNMTRDTRYKYFSGPVTRSSNCLLCFAEPVSGMRDLPTGLNWTATPQIVMRHGHEDVAGQARRNTGGHDLSLDVKVRPNSATVIDATINPDFSQIELDAPQLSSNTQFGLFVPEKRPFFLEGSDIFQMPFRAINTRAITDPSWGARFTRRDSKSDLTILTVRDAGGGLVQLPGPYATRYANQDFASIATVGRANFKLGAVTAGLTGSDRKLEGGRGYNRVAGPDFSWQRSDTERVRGQLLFSATTAQSDDGGTLHAGPRSSGHAGFADWSREEDRWAMYLATEDISDGFRDDNGFFSQVGYRLFITEPAIKFGPLGAFGDFNFYVHTERKRDRDGDLIAADNSPGLWMRGPYDTELNVRLRPHNQMRVVRGGEVFNLRTVWARIDTTPHEKLARVSAEVELGDMVDIDGLRRGTGGTVNLMARVRPHDRLEFEPTLLRRWVDGEGVRLSVEEALQLNGILHFSPHDTLRLIAQRAYTDRNRAHYPSSLAPHSISKTTSLVYGHTAGLGTAAYLGLTLSDGETPGYTPTRRQNELFAKLSWQI